MSTTPYRDTIPREAPGCSCAASPATPTPPAARRPIDWERLGIRLMWIGALVGCADLMTIIGIVATDTEHHMKPPMAMWWLLIPCAVLMVAGAASWWFAPDEETRAPSPSPPLPPRNWARVGAFTGLGGLLLYLADVCSAWTFCGAITADWPDPCRWLAVPCFVAVAVGVTVALCAPGKALPDLSV